MDFSRFYATIKKHGLALVSLAFPNLCLLCGRDLLKSEKGVCRICTERLPQTYFHKLPTNPVAQVFWGRVDVTNATAYLFFRKGEHTQKILHAIKYKGHLELGEAMGRKMGEALLHSNWIKDIDLIVPVPLHHKKQMLRGYNQSYIIANGISAQTRIPCDPHGLSRHLFTATQTRKGRYDRFKNMEGVFKAKSDSSLNGKHILLIDDVVTTGSTIEACAIALLKEPGTKVSVATLAYSAW